ncbi:unnamed protein product [Tilletia controversa]|nr:unnamed protein product [Tilletia controversa]CAD6904499.1 unnamed protein product [Tilletia controversa]CAD6911851.1 unnamed protein product [Tilletia controversa]CAD6985694.1 unnamed protein product [Tilletia controversa]
MVRLLTLTTIFLSSLVAFTMADTMAYRMANFVGWSGEVDRSFIHLYDVIVKPEFSAVRSVDSDFRDVVHEVVEEISVTIKVSWSVFNSTTDADFANPGNKADLEKLRNVLQQTYGKDGSSEKACQKLTEVAPRLKDIEKANGTKPGKRIADSFEILMERHGELLHSVTKFGNTGIPEVMHQATKLLLSTYFSLAS